jgi:hypothetical protein
VAGPTASALAASDVSQDSVVDKAGDWFATLGKSGSEKDQILIQRRSERIAKRMQKAVEDGSKKAGKEMEKMFK